ncbi:uncharacterized protein LOC128963913 [Oppia nitens]|uniref:uncharacterized protein LOC128963913 n=1 Tax=Oppia nitens TaxID=1686743 RepID=UPI0023DA3361|nr:uncharacterized protein LOC128963913 [Oppia nitens]
MSKLVNNNIDVNYNKEYSLVLANNLTPKVNNQTGKLSVSEIQSNTNNNCNKTLDDIKTLIIRINIDLSSKINHILFDTVIVSEKLAKNKILKTINEIISNGHKELAKIQSITENTLFAKQFDPKCKQMILKDMTTAVDMLRKETNDLLKQSFEYLANTGTGRVVDETINTTTDSINGWFHWIKIKGHINAEIFGREFNFTTH